MGSCKKAAYVPEVKNNGKFKPSAIKVEAIDNERWSVRSSSYEPGNRAGSLNGINFVVCSYGKFQPGGQDEIQETNQNGAT